MSLPTRTWDTLSDAIAMSSPNGRMSQRARESAQRRLAEQLFGPGGLTAEKMKGEISQEQKRANKILTLERTIADFKNFYPKQLTSPRDNSVKREYHKLLADLAALKA